MRVLLVVGMLCALCLPAEAQTFWPTGCDWVSGTTADFKPSTNHSFFADSIQTLPGRKIARLDVWNTSAKAAAQTEALFAIVQVYQVVNEEGGRTKFYASEPSATWNTSVFMGGTGGRDFWSIPVWTDRIWLRSSGHTVHWSWCAYCVPYPGVVSTGITVGTFTQ